MKKASVNDESPIKFLRRFSSIKVDYEKEKRKTISKYQQQGLRVSIQIPNIFQDKNDIRKQLRASVERYSLPELYVKMICALFPTLKAKEMPDSNALIQHLKHVFRLSDQEHTQLMDIARITKLPQRIINLEVVEARNLPAKDTNGLSDPFCVVFVNSRDVAQRTKVVHNSLNPIWKQYFTFKVNEPNRDVLHLEVMDYNEEDEPLRDRIKKFKEIKSPSTLGVLLKEIANARSVQELIGSLRIPVSEISSETIEKWFKLKNHQDRGEVYLRMALGYNKSKEAATEEFLQIIHLLLVYELNKDSSLGTPFYWDEHYDMWSKYILRQFKWQGGLKPKDIVLAKWRAYTTVNCIFPLNANMLCLLMDAVFERVLACEYDSREISRFWECTTTLLNTIYSFLTDLHDVLPCHVTVLHTYHMLKTLELLNQFLDSPESPCQGNVPFTKTGVVNSVMKAVRDGADKLYLRLTISSLYLKVFSDSTARDNLSIHEDPLLVAMENLLKMGQILHEDLRSAISTIHTDFKGIFNVDYLSITYAVYDEQYGKLVKHIVHEYNSQLLDRTEEGEVDDTSLDEDSPAVKVGLAVFKLYLAVKNLAELAPSNFANENHSSEFSLKRGFHDWFFHSVATWIDILRRRIMKWVKNSVSISDSQNDKSEELMDSKLSTMGRRGSKEIPISASAVDTAQMFLEIHKFWVSLGWQDPKQSYIIVRKILEEVYDYLIFYAAQIKEKLTESTGNKTEKRPSNPGSSRVDDLDAYLCRACRAINNIDYVNEQVELLAQQLNVDQIIEKLKMFDSNEDYEENIASIKTRMLDHVEAVMMEIIKSCVKTISPKYRQIIKEILSDIFLKSTNQPSPFKPVVDYLDNCLIILNQNLERQNFGIMLTQIWIESIEGVVQNLNTGIETGKPPEYFQKLNNLLTLLRSLFWPKDIVTDDGIKDTGSFDKYDDLKDRLTLLELTVEELKVKYYELRIERQNSTPISKAEHGAITIRGGYVEKNSLLVLELLNARNLKSYDSNDLSDPFAKVSLAPKESFPSVHSFTTKVHKETLFPLFEETFKFTLSKEEMSKKGFVKVTLFDYDLIGWNRLMGEVFLPFSEIKPIGMEDAIETLPQLHLTLTKPAEAEENILRRFEERSWEKDAVKFAKIERDKMK